MTRQNMRSVLETSFNRPRKHDAIDSLAGKRIFLYGAGNFGHIIHKLLVDSGFPAKNILGFLDREAESIVSSPDMPARHPDDKTISPRLRKEVVVVIAIYCSLAKMEAIRARLHDLGYGTVLFGYQIAICFYKANDPSTRITAADFFQKNKDHILKGLSCWQDSRSTATYFGHFMGYCSGDISHFLSEENHRQYFAKLPAVGKGYDRFVDCGAFTGDTLAHLFEHCGNVEALFVFEPDPGNLNALQTFIKANQHRARKIALFPCGVWHRIQQVRFSGNGAATSAVSRKGDTLIQCISIDAALTGFKPTFIKMDIEGAELKALQGAENTIQKNHPDLAVCLYHALPHFWEIPDFLRRLCPTYRFFLRAYGAAGFETVLYAIA